jgi:PAS domain S-box-containing protein
MGSFFGKFLTTRKRLNLQLTPLRIAVYYACIGFIWLLVLSVKMFHSLLNDPAAAISTLEIVNTIFILFSAWLLYYLISKSQFGVNERKEALHRLNRFLKAYSECNQALIRADDEMQLMQSICKTIVEAGEYRVAWVGLADNDVYKTIRPIVQWGDEQGYLKSLDTSWSTTDRGRGPTGTAIRTGKPVVAQFIKFDPKWELWREEALRHGFSSSMSLPLKIHDQTFAALVIFSGEECAFDDIEVTLLTELADDLSYGITSLRAGLDRKKIEKERKLLASVIEQANESILLFDEEGIIRYANPAAETITGFQPQALIGHNIYELEEQGPNKIFCAAFIKTISRGENNTGHFTFTRKDGILFEIEMIIWSVADAVGSVINYVALIRDVSYEIQLERQLRQSQRMEAIGTLAGGIAHDFNNSLASIITCSEIALDETTPGEPLQELLDVIHQSALRGKKLVKQILTFSRKGEQERQEVHVESVVKECLKLLRASLPASIEIRLAIGDDLGLVFSDPTLIHQIVMNLCTNSVHAMRGQPHGLLEIWLENMECDRVVCGRFSELQPGRYIRIAVKDNGHGMDEKTMERIFDPFFTTKGLAEGTGLGLSVIHGIVKSHNGAITIASEPGTGAVFTVYLPRMNVTSSSDDFNPVPIDSGNECILVVDDEESLLFSSEKMLTQLGYQIVACNDPLQALDDFRDSPDRFDLLITDQTMPGMRGTELAYEITRIRPELPVILCTGHDPLLSGAANGDGKIAECITELAFKPLERSELAAIVRRVIDAAALRK